ncbi:hypothetical protein BHM03_00054097 [Ensete ventricosum]|nr:hypothetical protein BHM03_00054097 [Ensete ventricosum]
MGMGMGSGVPPAFVAWRDAGMARSFVGWCWVIAASDAATVYDRRFPRFSASHRGLLGCSELPWFARLIVHGKEKTTGDVCVRGSWQREEEEWRALRSPRNWARSCKKTLVGVVCARRDPFDG